jgi:replicative DNA helicase
MEFKKYTHFSPELEEAILGCCLLEKEAFGRTFGIVDRDTFYSENHSIVYDSLAEMYSNGIPIDILTVNDFLCNRKNKSEFSGNSTAYFICKLTNSVVSSANLEYHCYIIKRMWMEREIIKLTHGGIELNGEVKENIFKLTSEIQRINQGNVVSDWSNMSQVVYDLMQHQDLMLKKKGMGVPTTIKVLDRENGGFWGGQMIVIGARPAVGKSAFAGQMAIGMAKHGVPVGIISLEMNNNEIAARLSSLETNEDFKTIFRNLYRDEDHRANWYQKMGNVVNLPIYISDSTHVDPIEIKAKATKLKHSHNLGCLIIDYLQLISASETSRNRTRENEVSQISRSIKLLAMELDIPVIILCQLNRASTIRKGSARYPQLSDLRESGSIEQDADVVMFIHRDWLLGGEYCNDADGNTTENQADLIVGKWRNGASNLHIKLSFDAPKMMFRQTEHMNTWKPENLDYSGDNPF